MIESMVAIAFLVWISGPLHYTLFERIVALLGATEYKQGLYASCIVRILLTLLFIPDCANDTFRGPYCRVV
jgi:hypothetical protein